VGQQDEWGGLFRTAFTQSRNAMVLLDGHRLHVDVNGAYLSLLGYRREDLIDRPIYKFIVGGPRLTHAQWRATMAKHKFGGEGELMAADRSLVSVQYAAHTEVVTGRQLALFVALSTSRWGQRFRRELGPEQEPLALSRREREVVRLIAMGNTGPEIAEELRIAHDTVRTHARNAMTKTGARSRAHLVAKALGEGLVLD